MSWYCCFSISTWQFLQIGSDIIRYPTVILSPSDCLVTLKQLKYISDLHSSDTLRQAVQWLPPKLTMKWAEFAQRTRRSGNEPMLLHLEQWLQDWVLALQEIVHSDHPPSNKKKPETSEKFTGEFLKSSELSNCRICEESHSFWKCKKFLDLKPNQRMDSVRKFQVCFNCFADGHKSDSCSSKNSCFESGCNKKHHTTLHGYFTKRQRLQNEIAKKRKEKGDQIKENENNTKAAGKTDAEKEAAKEEENAKVVVTG